MNMCWTHILIIVLLVIIIAVLLNQNNRKSYEKFQNSAQNLNINSSSVINGKKLIDYGDCINWEIKGDKSNSTLNTICTYDGRKTWKSHSTPYDAKTCVPTICKSKDGTQQGLSCNTSCTDAKLA